MLPFPIIAVQKSQNLTQVAEMQSVVIGVAPDVFEAGLPEISHE